MYARETAIKELIESTHFDNRNDEPKLSKLSAQAKL